MNSCPLCCIHNETILLQTKQFRIIAVENEVQQPAVCRVIWQAHQAEMTDLNIEERQQLMEAVFAVEAAMRHVLRPDKINLASLGNQVPHLHWHIIARFKDDECFPAPVWSQAVRSPNYSIPNNWIEQVQSILQSHYE